MRFWLLIGTAILSIIAGFLIWPTLQFYTYTGCFFPKHIVDSLHAPISVSEVRSTGIVTSDGRILMPPGIIEIPLKPTISKDLKEHGVEIDPNGFLYGLLRVHHYCGNDAVRFHLGRVNLSNLFILIQYYPNLRISEHGIDPGLFSWTKFPYEDIKEMYGTEPNGVPMRAIGSKQIK